MLLPASGRSWEHAKHLVGFGFRLESLTTTIRTACDETTAHGVGGTPIRGSTPVFPGFASRNVARKRPRARAPASGATLRWLSPRKQSRASSSSNTYTFDCKDR